MKIFVVVLFSLLFILFSDDGDNNSQKVPDNAIEQLLIETISDEDIPGIIAAIVDNNGLRMIEAAGIRKIGSSDSLTVDDLIHLGSCTKAMTSTLLATLVESGDIKWETTLIEVFPELEGIVHEDYHQITFHQLVTHRAGVPTNARDWWLFQELEIKERRVAMIKGNLNEPSLIKQGTYNYSNLGYMIAGSMVEKVIGTSWESLIKERLFNRLGMTSADFGIPGTLGSTDQPWGHIRSSENWRPIQADNAEALGPAGTVHSTFKDWAKFISLQLPDKEPEILNRDHLNFLIDPIGKYASGWGVVKRPWANGMALNHAGSNTMWYVVVWVAPELNRAFMVGMNSFDENSFSIADEIIGELIEFDQSQ
ncbi:MAG: serine hydrolase domain-containing protein [Bacteroidota bacterium]